MAVKNMSTLCYIQRENSWLMLHRTVKREDVNKDKWIGVGGHFEEEESPEECVLREVREETGYTLTSYAYRGLVTFVSGDGMTEYMSLFTADGFEGEAVSCDEGELEWVPSEQVWQLNIWEGDKIFFRLLEEGYPFFSLKLVYDGQGGLAGASLNGKPMELFDILNENGSKSGLVQERGVVHFQGSLHPTVHLWIVRKREDGSFDVLLQKRSAGKDSYPGCYDISSAGHVGAGEDILESVLREAREELGLEAAAEDLNWVGTHRRKKEAVFGGRRFRDYELGHIYFLDRDLDPSKLVLQESEVEQVMWIEYQACLRAVEEEAFPHCMDLEELRMLDTAFRRSISGSRK